MSAVAACFCARGVDVPAGEEFSVVVCSGCGQPWAVWARDGVLVSQVKIDPGATFEDVWYRLRLYGLRGSVGAWESAETKAGFAAVWAARLRWERETRLGRWTVWLFGLPVLRMLKGTPFWVVARIFSRWGMPEHLQGRTVKTTAADRARIRRMTGGRA